MDAFIVSAVRTPVGLRNGILRDWHAVDLMASVLRRIGTSAVFEPGDLDGVITGCATPVGEQALNVSRSAVLAAGWPDPVFAVTVDAQHVSSCVALHDAAARVSSGMASVCVAGGVEAMSRVPAGASTGMGVGKPFGPAVRERYAERDGLVPPGVVAERMAARYGLTRSALDAYARESIERHVQNLPSDEEITPLIRMQGREWQQVSTDEVVSHADDLECLKASFVPDGVITAGNCAGAADGAAAILVLSSSTLEQSHVKPIGRVLACAESGFDPLIGDSGFQVASKALKSLDLSFSDVDRIELQEDSAATPLAFAQDSGLDPAQLNMKGGALGSGQPVGAAGAILITRLLHGLERAGSLGLAISAGSGGLATATVVERLDP